MRMHTFTLSVISLLLCCGIALASNGDTTVFPPKTMGGQTCPAGETTILAWNNGATTTYCLDAAETRDLAVPDQNAAQIILKRALPTCATGDEVVKTDSGFSCEAPVSLPTCTDTQYLWSDGHALSCREFETKVCTPSWVTTGVGTCSVSCGGGVQDVYQSDGCSHTRTLSQACNTQSCGVTCTPGSKTFTTPGSYNFVAPAGYKTITAEVWGGGQYAIVFGWTGDVLGYPGAASSFNGSLVATGGGPGRAHPGTGSGGDVNLTGEPAWMEPYGTYSIGGTAPFGGPGGYAPNPTSNTNPAGQQPGGGGAVSGCIYGLTACIGGASGGYAKKTYTVPSLYEGASIPVVVGGGGRLNDVLSADGGSSSGRGANAGGDGMVKVQWTCQ